MNSREPRNGAMGVAETREVVAVLMRQTISIFFVYLLINLPMDSLRADEISSPILLKSGSLKSTSLSLVTLTLCIGSVTKRRSENRA